MRNPASYLIRIRDLIDGNKCIFLTVVLVLYLLVYSLAGDMPQYAHYLTAFYYVFLIFTPYFVTSNKKVLLTMLILGGIFLLARHLLKEGVLPVIWFGEFYQWGSEGTLLFFEIIVVLSIVGYTSISTNNQEPIVASVLTYMLIGVVFADIYVFMNQYYPGCFARNGVILEPPTLNEMIYFSYATLTTAGGDILPVKPLSRIIFTFEAVFGVLYVAIFVAKVVANTTSGHLDKIASKLFMKKRQNQDSDTEK